VTNVALIKELAECCLVETVLDQDRVDHRQRGRRQRRPGDQRRLEGPVKRQVGDQRTDDERPDERNQPDPDRRAEARTEIARVHLEASEKGEHDRGERRDEVEPLLRLELEDVADHDAEAELEQSDGDPQLDREHAGEHHHGGEDRGELDWFHRLGSTNRVDGS
jgi:hypothetical protein